MNLTSKQDTKRIGRGEKGLKNVPRRKSNTLEGEVKKRRGVGEETESR